MLASIARLASRIVTMRSRADTAAREQLHEREIAGGSALWTRRGAEVVHCLCRGMKTAEIANRFRISPRTIEHHLRHIYRKLRVSGRRELIDALGYDRRE